MDFYLLALQILLPCMTKAVLMFFAIRGRKIAGMAWD